MKVVVPRQIAEDVWVLVLGRRPLDTNVYLVRSGTAWVLIDTGWPGNGPRLRRAAEAVFGGGAVPAAILLTHLHLDHSGSVRELVAAWDVPVFVHPRELPLAAGYVPEYANPLDERVLLPLLRLLPRRLRERALTGDGVTDIVRALDPAAPPPCLPDWSCVPAHGHTPGSVAFFRRRDRLLVTGDALLTVDLSSVRGLLRGRAELAPPLRFTDWDRTATEGTISALARLAPRTIAPGHGRPRSGPSVPHDLRDLAGRLPAPGETTDARATAHTHPPFSEGTVMDTVVETRNGRVRGTTQDTGSVFLGISYAAPPVGAHRLRPPQPVVPWTGVRDATTFGPEPPQPQFGMNDPSGLVFDPAVPGDDCLNLNVWTPDPRASGLPVMVWSPGGSFHYNSAASYDGSRFARDGVVCVTINWRTGADGFLYLGDGDDGANLGLLDQIAALTWVRDNIAAFGGNPARVTVFGESAGAMSIGVLLSMPRAEGLFRRAILQSGAAHHVLPAAAASRIGARLAEVLGVPATREAIAQVPIDRLLEAQGQVDLEVLTSPDPAVWGAEVVASIMPFHPVVDGDVVPAEPIQRITAGAAADVDVLVGTNSDDWRMFPVLGGFIDQVTDEALTGPVGVYGSWSMAAFGLPAETALPAYRAAHPDGSPGDLLAAVLTDWWVRVPAIRLADAHAPAPAGTFMYEFAWPSPAFGGRLRACHALEIPFVFDTLDLGTKQMLGGALGENPPQQLADTMHAAWVRFATDGDPGWPRYDIEHRATMRFDTSSSVVDDPYARERDLWAGVR